MRKIKTRERNKRRVVGVFLTAIFFLGLMLTIFFSWPKAAAEEAEAAQEGSVNATSSEQVLDEIEILHIIERAEITAYNSVPWQTDDTPFITASGKHVSPRTAACPQYLPFGTEIEIYGHTYVCEDRMAKKYRNGAYFDIWMDSYEDAIEFGRQITTVTVLNYEN